MLVSAFFTILYSFEWGGEKSTAWLTAFLLSFLESVILIQPLKAKLTYISIVLLSLFAVEYLLVSVFCNITGTFVTFSYLLGRVAVM